MKNHKKSSKNRKQKLYKMRGCSRTCKRRYRGGSADVPLAYPANVPSVPNPHLAYTGKGGSSCSYGITPDNLAYTQNINAANPAYPNTGPESIGYNFLNSSTQRGGMCQTCDGIKPMSGGGCNCGATMTGGKYGYGVGSHMNPACPLNQLGGSHRVGCKCSNCKDSSSMKGGSGIPYPNGLVGTAWSANNAGLPGVNGVPGDSNYYKLNTYDNDISRQMVDLGSAPPFTGGRTKMRKNKKGGAITSFFGQDLINLGRGLQYGIGSSYNAIQGYGAPVNPLPWKDQIPNSVNAGTIKMFAK